MPTISLKFKLKDPKYCFIGENDTYEPSYCQWLSKDSCQMLTDNNNCEARIKRMNKLRHIHIKNRKFTIIKRPKSCIDKHGE